jgi:hypothetical protein
MSGLQIRRYRGMAAVAAPLGAILAALNFSLLAACGPAPAWLVPQYLPMTWETLEQNQSRVAALAAAAKGEADEYHAPFLLYIGQSSANRGIDPAAMRANGCGAWPVELYGAGGAGMHVLVTLTEPLTGSGLEPRLSFLCVHPAWLIGVQTEQPPASLDPLPAVGEGRWKNAAEIVGWWNWFGSNKTYLHHGARGWFNRLRTALGFTPPARNPWDPTPLVPLPEYTSPEALLAQVQDYEVKRRWFDPEEYSRHRATQLRNLWTAIERVRGLGGRVVVVIMPEQTYLRRRVPASAREYLLNSLRYPQDGLAVEVLDLQDAVPDSMFFDYSHLNAEGRARLSGILAEWCKGHRLK